MISLNPLYDQWEIKKALTRDNIYLQCTSITDLYSHPVDLIGTLWFEVKSNNIVIGFVFIKSFTGSYIAFHGGLYKEFRGKKTSQILKEILNIITSWGLNLIIPIKKSNKQAIHLIHQLKYKQIASIPDLDKEQIVLFVENK